MRQLIESLAKASGKTYEQIKTDLQTELETDLKIELSNLIDDALELDSDDNGWYVTIDSIDTAAERIVEQYIVVDRES